MDIGGKGTVFSPLLKFKKIIFETAAYEQQAACLTVNFVGEHLKLIQLWNEQWLQAVSAIYFLPAICVLKTWCLNVEVMQSNEQRIFTNWDMFFYLAQLSVYSRCGKEREGRKNSRKSFLQLKHVVNLYVLFIFINNHWLFKHFRDVNYTLYKWGTATSLTNIAFWTSVTPHFKGRFFTLLKFVL